MSGEAFDRLFAQLEGRAQVDLDAVAFVCDDEACTWAELDLRARRAASLFAVHGVEAGARVAVLAGTSLDLLVVVLACYRCAAICVPINTRYREGELSHVLSDSAARLVACDAAGAAALDALPAASVPPRLGVDDLRMGGEGVAIALSDADALEPRATQTFADDTPCLMIYTSGTTGASKGVVHDFASVVGAIEALTGLWRFSPADHQVLALPLFHVHGLCIGVHGAWLRGVTTTLLRRFSVEAIHAAFVGSADAPLERGPERGPDTDPETGLEGGPERDPHTGVRASLRPGASIFMGVPTMYAMLLEWLEAEPARAEALRSARLFTAGSAALSARDFARFEALTGHRILERYGMSETLITLSNPYAGERRPGAVGRPVPGFEVRVVDESGAPVAAGEIGELQVRGVGLMQGYWQRPEATAESFDGPWFRTGDVVREGEGGYLSIVGRSSVDIIKSGGFKISAREIEEALLATGDYREVAVLGLPDPRWGELIVAALVPHQDVGRARSPEAWVEQLAVQLRDKLADYKRPRRVLIIDEIPKNALGKVQKHRLKARFGTE